jgi:hypothetical protein
MTKTTKASTRSDSPSHGATPWEALPGWLRTRFAAIGPDQVTDSGWAELVESKLPIEIRGLDLYWLGAGPNHGEPIAYQIEPPAEGYLGLDEDEEGMRAAGWDESEARQCGLLSIPLPPAPDRDNYRYGPDDD